MSERIWFTALVANLVTNTTLVKHSSYIPQENTSTSMLWSTSTEQTEHNIDWGSTIFLESDAHWRKRKIKESLLKDCLNSGKAITSKSIMNLEKWWEISDCWKEFNPEIRRIFSKKILRKFSHIWPLCIFIVVLGLTSHCWWNKHRERRGPCFCSWKRHHWMPKIWVLNDLLEIKITVPNFINHHALY